MNSLLHKLLLLFALLILSSGQVWSQYQNIQTLVYVPTQLIDIQPLDEVEKFEKGSFILHLGGSFRKDIILENESILKSIVPPATIFLEKAYWKNVGIGLKAGFRWWKDEKLNYNYRYYGLSLRAAYHFNLHENFDPYVGIGLSSRGASLGNGQSGEWNVNFDYNVMLGVRYYFWEKTGVYVEYGSDVLGYFHAGFCFKLK